MAYKLIIIDDEDIIRNGLQNVVDWTSLGFEVAADMQDGRDAIEYIQNNRVDVVITDIKMTYVSGLELARYIFENKPEIQVVIISGYKEFDFAKQAMSYNVSHYLLKPIEYDELVKVFDNVRNQLDREYMDKQRFYHVRSQHAELIPFAQQQFFTDIVMGALQNRSMICDRLKLVGLDIDVEHWRCCILIIRILDMEQFLKSNNHKDLSYIELYSMINREEHGIKYIAIYNEHDRIHVIGTALEVMEEKNFRKSMGMYTNKLMENVKANLNMSISVGINSLYRNLCEMAADAASSDLTSNSNEYERLVVQQKMLLSYIRTGSLEEACNLFTNIINKPKPLDHDMLKNFFSSLFVMIENLLKEIGFDLFSATKGNFNYKKIFDSTNGDEIIPWVKDNLILVIEHIREHEGVSEEQIIAKAKEYIWGAYSKEISLEDVSEHVYLSSGYFSKLFKQYTGENYIDYLIRIRMEKAKELLETTVYKTFVIGEAVGYPNTKYFFRLFKKYTGLTPSEYRNLYSGREIVE
ncbi:MAG: two component transcriptional regulator, AraC family [Paenibacillaceae bacterium]|jgi:two-component system response regulator YesN|nr:two component transcriptional regulator, AraC family [Paenibacillaceae bacterium]